MYILFIKFSYKSVIFWLQTQQNQIKFFYIDREPFFISSRKYGKTGEKRILRVRYIEAYHRAESGYCGIFSEMVP